MARLWHNLSRKRKILYKTQFTSALHKNDREIDGVPSTYNTK